MTVSKQKQSQPSSQSQSYMDSIKQSTKNMFQKVPPYERLMCTGTEGNSNAVSRAELKKERLRSIRHEIAKSKSGVWGPTHSFDSEDENENGPSDKKNGRRSSKGDAVSGVEPSPQKAKRLTLQSKRPPGVPLQKGKDKSGTD